MAEFIPDKAFYQRLQAEHEALLQSLHDSEMRKRFLTSTLNECKEIVSQAENADEKKALELEECQIKKIKLQSKARKEEEAYENEIINKKNYIQTLKFQVDVELKKLEDNSSSIVDENNQKKEVLLLQDQHNSLLEILDELHVQLTSKEKEHLALLDKVKELEEDLNHYKEVSKCKKAEFEEKTEVLNNLHEKYFELKTEFDAARNKPLDTKTRGNSMFAVVDDRRIQLEDNIQKMKLQYLEMKRQQSANLKEISTIRNENIKMSTEIQEKLDKNWIEEKDKIKQKQEEVVKLTKLIEENKIEIKGILSRETSLYSRLNIFKRLVERKAEELSDIRDQLQIKAKDNVGLTFKMLDNQKELFIREAEIMKLESDISERKTAIIKSKMEIDENTLLNKEAEDFKLRKS